MKPVCNGSVNTDLLLTVDFDRLLKAFAKTEASLPGSATSQTLDYCFVRKEEYQKEFDAQKAKGKTDKSVVQYEADISIDCAPAQRVAVNSPLTPRWNENLYLVSYDQNNPSPTYVVVQIVRQPWRHLLLAGIVMLMLGTLLLFGRTKKTN